MPIRWELVATGSEKRAWHMTKGKQTKENNEKKKAQRKQRPHSGMISRAGSRLADHIHWLDVAAT